MKKNIITRLLLIISATLILTCCASKANQPVSEKSSVSAHTKYNIPKEKIIVVRNDECDENIRKAGGKNHKGEPLFDGNFDHIQDILIALNIPYTLIGKSELEKESYSLDDKWAIIFNSNFFYEHCCNPEHLKLLGDPHRGTRVDVCPGDSNHIIHSTKLSDKTIVKIKEFVETGGYLFTEDLNIEEIIEKAFRNIITHTHFLPERELVLLPAHEAITHIYIANIFTELPQQGIKWKCADECPNIWLLDKSSVTTLLYSTDLKEYDSPNQNKYGEGAIAVTFSVPIGTNPDDTKILSKGKVLHILGRLGEQDPRAQKLLYNFLMELNKERPRDGNH